MNPPPPDAGLPLLLVVLVILEPDPAGGVELVPVGAELGLGTTGGFLFPLGPLEEVVDEVPDP